MTEMLDVLAAARRLYQVGQFIDSIAKLASSRKLGREQLIAGVVERLRLLLQSWARFSRVCQAIEEEDNWVRVMEAYRHLFLQDGVRFVARSKDAQPVVIYGRLKVGDEVDPLFKELAGGSHRDDLEVWMYACDDDGYHYKFNCHQYEIVRTQSQKLEEWSKIAERELAILRTVSDATWTQVEELYASLTSLTHTGHDAMVYANQDHWKALPREVAPAFKDVNPKPPPNLQPMALALQAAGRNSKQFATELEQMLLGTRDPAKMTEIDITGPLSDAFAQLNAALA